MLTPSYNKIKQDFLLKEDNMIMHYPNKVNNLFQSLVNVGLTEPFILLPNRSPGLSKQISSSTTYYICADTYKITLISIGKPWTP